MDGNDRAQTHTLEAIIASFIIISTIVFALNATVVTPLTTSTSNQHIENQQQSMAEGVLRHSSATGILQHQLLYWNEDKRRFVNSTQTGYHGHYPDTPFGDILGDVFEDRRVATNVYITFERVDGGTGTKRVIYNGNPSDNAVSATETVVLYDDMELTGPTDTTLENTTDYYTSDMYPDSAIYNVVTVRVEVWRI